PDGDADVGLRQRRGVVDAVTDHGHDAPLLLERPDLVRLVLGPDPGEHLVDAQLVGHRAGDRLGVTGDHDDLDAQVVQGVDGFAGLLPHLVGDAQGAHDAAVADDVQHGGPVLRPVV